MAAFRGARQEVGSAPWLHDERSTALQIAQSETEDFSFSVRNELDWLNEHMAGVFDENERNIAETFKTPGKLKNKTPRTAHKTNFNVARVPLSDVFSSNQAPSSIRHPKQIDHINSPKLQIRAQQATNVFRPVSPQRIPSPPKPTNPAQGTQDSGYYGSQDIGSVTVYADVDMDASHFEERVDTVELPSIALPNIALPLNEALPPSIEPESLKSATRLSTGSHHSLRDDPESAMDITNDERLESNDEDEQAELVGESPRKDDLEHSATTPVSSPLRTPREDQNDAPPDKSQSPAHSDEDQSEHNQSPSDRSSPIRSMVRKSSLNFASLPAREPLTAGKSIGARVSRTSHIDHNRNSHYQRPTGGKSLSAQAQQFSSDGIDVADSDELETGGAAASNEVPKDDLASEDNLASNHNKTYTQRLQDQISLLGKSQALNAAQSKALPSLPTQAQQSAELAPPTPKPLKSSSPMRKDPVQTTPGAFPADEEEEDEEEEDWIEPPAATIQNKAVPRPMLAKAHTADVMEGIQVSEDINSQHTMSPTRKTHTGFGAEQAKHAPHFPSYHAKSASTSIPSIAAQPAARDGLQLMKAATISNPSLPSLDEAGQVGTPKKSPSRSFRDSPLKQVKNKLSSILKSSKSLLASSAAISAEGKSSLLSPSTTRLGYHPDPSTDSIIPRLKLGLQNHYQSSKLGGEPASPTRPVARRTRASTEREKEQKRREKEEKRIVDQTEKLEKAREKEREKARVFSKEQEKAANVENQVVPSNEIRHLQPQETPKPTRTSPRKAENASNKELYADIDVEMHDAANTMPPPSAPRSVGPQSIRGNDLKRPMKPLKDAQAKVRQAPTVIRVNMGSQQPQQSHYHPASSTVSTTSQESYFSASSQGQQSSSTKPSKPTLHTKVSTQSLRGGTTPAAASSAARPKGMDLTAKKREQEEREVQRRRDAKAEVDRKRTVSQEEQRKQEQQRRQEAERAKQREREQTTAQTEAKKQAQRQATIEKAKQTRAPPPAPRSQFQAASTAISSRETAGNGYGAQRTETGQASRPPSRMATGPRPQEDAGRPVNAILSNGVKAGAKRTLGAENDLGQPARPPSRAGISYQAKEAKRRRTSEQCDELDSDQPPNIKGPPVRPSAGFKKDLSSKTVFQAGYTHAPASATRDLFKATVTTQHNSNIKTANPLEMAQISKGAIPFAPKINAATTSAAHKTPARVGQLQGGRSVAKSAQKSSPRFQNGDSIELPEIQTDDEDEDSDDGQVMNIAAWADSPDLRRALMRQETMDPSQIFGPPAPLNMEEVFSKSKDRWHKFRARTSSANWSGTDRLTEEDIRKDMVARDKLRREGGWSYQMSKDMI